MEPQRLRVAQLTIDNRNFERNYGVSIPYFGAAPQALLEGFASLQGIEVHVLSCTRQPMQSPEKLADNILFHSLHVPKWGWMRTLYQGTIRATRKALRRIQPDLVHGQGTEFSCALDAVFSGRPSVVTLHGIMSEQARLYRARPGSFLWLAARLEKAALRRTLGVFCNSAYTEATVRPRAARTWRVPNAIHSIYFNRPADVSGAGKCRLLNVGFVSPRKRQVELLDLARQLYELGLNFELCFVGQAVPDTPYACAFLEKIKHGEAKGYARYAGSKSREELIDCLDTAHGFIHFPSEEAFGLVVAEALARGLRLFGSRLGGILDICDGVPDAELFDSQDWQGLGSALATWVRAGYPRGSSAAKLMRERYHPQVIAGKHLEIYRALLASS